MPQKEMSEWLFYTESDLAKMLGVSLSKIRKDRQHSTGIAYYKIGGCVKYHESDIRAYLDSRRIEIHDKYGKKPKKAAAHTHTTP